MIYFFSINTKILNTLFAFIIVQAKAHIKIIVNSKT